MTQTPSQGQDTGKRQPQPASGQARSGAEHDEAGQARAQAEGTGRYSGSLQTRGGQGQVSARGGQPEGRQAQAMLPPVDIFEDEAGVTLLADMPGVTREQLQVRVEGDTLLIEGAASVPDVGELELTHGELLSPHYRRSFTLSRDLDPGKIDAQLQQGVLTLRIHKAEQAKPRRIEVKVS